MPRRNNANAAGAAPAPAPANAPAAAAPAGNRNRNRNTWIDLDRQAKAVADVADIWLRNKHGNYLIDSDGEACVIFDGKRVPLNLDKRNHELNTVLIESVRLSRGARYMESVIFHWTNIARKKAGKMKLRRFSALSSDRTRLYLPVNGVSGTSSSPSLKDVLLITADAEPKIVPNGTNQDGFWLEHPYGQPFRYDPTKAQQGLQLLEELIVNKQTVQVPGMAWFSTLQSIVFSHVRELHDERALLFHLGGSDSGKTWAAKWCAVALGLPVKGDATCASVDQLGDTGMLLLDNKEQRNISSCMLDKLIFLYGGGDSDRGSPSGKLRTHNQHRPVAVLSSIEGPSDTEVVNRSVIIRFFVEPERRKVFIADEHKALIIENRDAIMSGVVLLLQRFMRLRKDERQHPENYPAIDMPDVRFQGNYQALVKLLRLYAELTDKEPGWAGRIESVWRKQFSGEPSGNEMLAFRIRQSLSEMVIEVGADNALVEKPAESVELTLQDQPGKVYLVSVLALFEYLKSRNRLGSFKTWQALNSRLSEASTDEFRLLRYENEAVQAHPQLRELLKPTKRERRVGFFVPSKAPGRPSVAAA